MDYRNWIIVALITAASMAQAQVASHAPTLATQSVPATLSTVNTMQVTGKPVARVNGAVLNDRDLLREMLVIFPYARTHNGFPKGQEASIRGGALKMIEFEELVYQEAERRKMTVAPERVKKAAAAFRARFQSEEDFQQYIKTEMNGSMEQYRKSVRRSLLIDAFLKSQLELPSRVTLAEAREFYRKNSGYFLHPEQIQFQTISVMPAEKASSDVKEQARKQANELWQQANATHNYEEFGLLAEKYSQDDFRVDMGNHKATPRTQLPPEVLAILDPLKQGQVSRVCQFGPYYAIFRLEARIPAGKKSFEQVRASLQDGMHKERYNTLRQNLDKKLRTNAKVEEL
jgi:parvulin-like peptidyl-prolyl isomerase